MDNLNSRSGVERQLLKSEDFSVYSGDSKLELVSAL
jgi:hypothetical protein